MHRRRRSDRDRGGTRLSDQVASDGGGDPASIERAALNRALLRVADGDPDALHEVYRRAGPKLYGVCLRIFPDRAEAEDALQEAFVTIWRNADRYDPARGSPITWLVTVARNRAIDRARRHGGVAASPIGDADHIADDTPDAHAVLVAAQGAARVRACVDTLGMRDAEMIRTAFFDGASYADIASRADLPLGTVKSRIRRALVKLRECLQ